jgi:hypothetical protein
VEGRFFPEEPPLGSSQPVEARAGASRHHLWLFRAATREGLLPIKAGPPWVFALRFARHE